MEVAGCWSGGKLEGTCDGHSAVAKGNGGGGDVMTSVKSDGVVKFHVD